jgi:UDP-N-acetylmuramate: L-alanyl-gamma-D-glutamyl-meso-diaminopimelate ligase
MDSINYYNKKITDPEILKFISNKPKLPESPKKVHVIGVCGTGMGQLAGLLKDKGFEVSGSDQQCYPPVSTMVESLGINLHIGNFQKENINNTDLVVVGNVVRSHNPEATYARQKNIPQVSFPETLTKYVFQDARRLVVAGTHGKTTTTGLLAHIFDVAGKEPGYMIGGVPQGKDTGYKLGSGQYAIFEGDEYDTSYFDKRPKFLHYGASSAIITSLELDHMDIYDSFDSYKQAFIFFVEDLPEDGHLFLSELKFIFMVQKKSLMFIMKI